MGGLPAARQHVFTLGHVVRPYPAGYSCCLSPCLSAAGFRFLPHPVPSEELGLPCGRATEFVKPFRVFKSFWANRAFDKDHYSP